MIVLLVGLSLVLAPAAGARARMKRAADQLRNTREAVEKGVTDGRLEGSEPGGKPGKDAPAEAPPADPPAPPRVPLDRSQPWADACEADARVRVKEHRTEAADVVFAAAEAKEWQESPGIRGVEGKGDFLGWGGSRSRFSYRCRYDVEQRKVTWGRVTIGR
jgi:hypothetical protein